MAWEQGSKWRRFVLDANDGIVATAGLVEGLVGARASTGSTRLAAAASLIAGSLEASNVDPTRELIDLIRTQRAFEMNSQSIRAADESLQSVAQLGR